MRNRKQTVKNWCWWGIFGLVTWAPTFAWADAFEDYELRTTFQLEDGTGPIDVLSDGRIVALAGNEVFVENATGSREFDFRGVISTGDFHAFGAAFIRISPDGSRLAVGNGGGSSFVDFEVGILDFDTLDGVWFAANHFQALWIDDTQLLITAGGGGNTSSVTVLDTTSSDLANPSNVTVLEGVGGSSGGIALDSAGNLFTGNGFASIGPSDTGTIKAFGSAAWTGALAGGSIPNFEDDGTLVAVVLSASPLGFDSDGNLFVGGGPNENENDGVGLVRASVVARALSGGAEAEANDPTEVRRFDPITDNDSHFYTANYNPVTRELYVWDSEDSTVYVYADEIAVPAVSQWGFVVMFLSMLIIGTAIVRGRELAVPSRINR